MNFQTFSSRLLAAASVMAIVAGAYIFFARPHQLTRGATTAEIDRPMPGDELDLDPSFLATRAITINAPAKDIWPWLVQMGFSRAGFYGYDIIEGIGSKTGMRSSDTIIPALQNISVGDEIPLSLFASTTVYAIEPCRYIIWAGKENGKPRGGFVWALYPIDSSHTRLVSRIRWTHHWSNSKILLFDLFTDLADYLAVREIFRGIKARAEGNRGRSSFVVSAKFFVLLALPVTFFIILLRLIVLRLSMKRCILALVCGVLWLTIWYGL